jgi:SagB-type dehydrogenase family enzyme
VRLRRARAVLAYWQDGRLTFENYLTRQVISTDPIAIHVLGFFEIWRDPASLARALPQFTPASLRSAVATLERHTLLVRHGSPAAAEDALLARTWRTWLPQASFHFATKDTPFIPQRKWPAVAKAFLDESSPPPFFKTMPGRPRRALPDPADADGEFARVLLARRTHRDFAKARVPLGAISTLLHYTWGRTGTVLSPTFGPLVRKTSPSGGARHPGEVYLVAFEVEGLARGVYHFNARDHVLERLPGGVSRREMLAFAVGQRHVSKAAAVFLMTAYFPRSMWKYKSPRAYRVVTLDTGHLGQTFCLVATWLGLAPFTTAAMRDTAIERALGIDGITESTTYIAGVGMPAAATAPPRAGGARRPRAARRRRP